MIIKDYPDLNFIWALIILLGSLIVLIKSITINWISFLKEDRKK